MMNYCTSLARSGSSGDQLNELQANDNDNDSNNIAREHLAANRVGDLLKLNHLNLNDSQPDQRHQINTHLSHLFEGVVQLEYRRENQPERRSGRRSADMLSSLGEQCPEEANQGAQLQSQPALVEPASDAIALVEHEEPLGGSQQPGEHFGPQTNQNQLYEQHQYGFMAAQYPSAYPGKPAEPRYTLLEADFGPLMAQHQEASLQSGFEFLEQRCPLPAGEQQQEEGTYVVGSMAPETYKGEPAGVYTSLDAGHFRRQQGGLPEPVIRLNYQQENCDQCQFEQHQHPFGAQQQMSGHYRASSSAQSERSLINLESVSEQQHLQQQDSGHVSSVSCMDSAGYESALSLVGGGSHLRFSEPDRRAALSLESRHSDLVHPMQSSGSGHSSCSYHNHHHHHHHRLEPELKLCEWADCENTFLDMKEFVRHLEERHVNQAPKEKNRYYCQWANCKRNDQEFNARYKLLIHMRVHSGEKPYPCDNDNCKKRFSRLENLKIHVRSHTGEKPYKCSFDNCSKSFTNSSDRIKHHKTHKDPKPYSCQYASCAKRYTDPSSLRKHLRAHKRASQLETTGGGVPSADDSGVRESAGGVICPADFNPASLLPGQFEGGGGADNREFERHYSEPGRLPMEPQHGREAWSGRQQDSRYSQSWSAGLTRPLEPDWARAGRPLFDNHDEGSTSCVCCLSAGEPAVVQHQLQQHQHEALGRSLPPGGGGGGHFRAAHSAASSSFAGALTASKAHLSPESSGRPQRGSSLSCPNCGSLELSCQGCQSTERAGQVAR